MTQSAAGARRTSGHGVRFFEERMLRPNRRPRSISIVALRIAELSRLFVSRYGETLPDDDAGREDFAIITHHFAGLPAQPMLALAAFRAQRAPWLTDDEFEAVQIDLLRPQRWKADELAALLGVTAAERDRLGLTTIGCIDQTRRQRILARKMRKRLAEARRRQAKGGRSRPEYLAKVRAPKPWLEAGVSERTWYRRKRAETLAAE